MERSGQERAVDVEKAAREQPRATLLLLNMHEAMAAACDELRKNRDKSPADFSAGDKASLERFDRMYERKIGVNPAERKKLRTIAEDAIANEPPSKPSPVQLD